MNIGRGAMVMLVIVGTACTDPTANESAGWLSATVVEDESEVTTLLGTGTFSVGPDPALGVDERFSIWAAGTGLSEGETIHLVRSGAGRPPPGEYELGPLTGPRDGARTGFMALYSRDDRAEGGLRESFTVESGVVRITESSESGVAGTFRFSAVVYCWIGPDWPEDQYDRAAECRAYEPLVDGARVVIEGSFSASAWTDEHIVDDIG